MSSSRKRLALALMLALLAGAAQAQAPAQRFPGIGRAATPAEVAAWDIDVRPDFKGLPAGSGSVAKGQEVWEAKCASCHGVFGESNEVFNPLVGGTTEDDIRTGRVRSLARNDYPGRTTLMKLAHVSTLWDYIRRAMPWNQPKSLTTEEVYATTAYLLHMGGVVSAEFVLSDRNIDHVQQKLPNRNGLTRDHAMWPGGELGEARKPDVTGSSCMRDCPAETKVASRIPEHARDAHGELSQQQRLVGPQRGAPVAGATAAAAAAPRPAPAKAELASIPMDVLQKNSCTACHAPDNKLVGPSWRDIARKHAGKADYLAGKIRSGGVGSWGPIPMPPQTLGEQDAMRVARWLASGAAP